MMLTSYLTNKTNKRAPAGFYSNHFQSSPDLKRITNIDTSTPSGIFQNKTQK